MRGITKAAALLIALGAYAVAVRPRLLRWGATEEEVEGEYPGAEIIQGGERTSTMAVTIDAPPSKVWPWLVQMGLGRGGWYSFDHLDNWGHASSDRIHPEWQEIAVGMRLSSMPGERAWWEVAALEPQRFLGLRASFDALLHPFDPSGERPNAFTDSLWAFQLKEEPMGRTRLVVSGYWARRPRWFWAIANAVFIEPSHWIMETRQFANLKRRAEGAASPPELVDVSAAGSAAADGIGRAS
jgi:proline iminopeptidase